MTDTINDVQRGAFSPDSVCADPMECGRGPYPTLCGPCEDHEKAAELAAAFAPCTLSGLADELWKLNVERGRLRKEAANIEAILLDASMKDHNGKDFPFREGALIEGRERRCRAIWRLVEGGEHPKWEPRLEFLR